MKLDKRTLSQKLQHARDHEARMRLIMAPLGIVERIAPKTWAGVLIRDPAFDGLMEGRAGTGMFTNFEGEDFGHIGRSDNIE